MTTIHKLKPQKAESDVRIYNECVRVLRFWLLRIRTAQPGVLNSPRQEGQVGLRWLYIEKSGRKVWVYQKEKVETPETHSKLAPKCELYPIIVFSAL